MKKKYPTKQEFAILVSAWKSETDKRKQAAIAQEVVLGLEGLTKMVASKCISFFPLATLEDAMQAGRIGILHALRKWDSERSNGASFSTYAALWIKASVYNYTNKECCGSVYVSQSRKANLKKLGPEAMTAARIVNIPWDAPAGATEEGDTSLTNGDLLTSREDLCASNGAADISDRMRGEKLMKLVGRLLTLREQKVLFGRMEGLTLREVGDQIGTSRERARQIEEFAKKKVLAHVS